MDMDRSRNREALNPTTIPPKILADQLATSIIPRHPTGFTLDPRTGEINSFPPGPHIYIASLWGLERRFSGRPHPQLLLPWLKQAAPLLSDRDKVIGWWFNTHDGQYYLDVSVYCWHKLPAMQLAVAGQQRTIYWPHGRQEIPVNREAWYAKLGLNAA